MPCLRLYLCVLFCAVSAAVGQVPASVLIGKAPAYRQVNATELQYVSDDFSVLVDFDATPASGAKVELQVPGGATYALQREPDHSYSYDFSAANAATLDARFPNGTYTLRVTGGTQNTTTTFTLTYPARRSPVRITNFDELQHWPTAYPAPRWEPITGTSQYDLLVLAIERPDGSLVWDNDAGDPPFFTSRVAGPVPFNEPLIGGLAFMGLSVAEATNGVPVVVLSGFLVEFPLRSEVKPPVVVSAPATRIVQPGDLVSLEMTLEGSVDDGTTFTLSRNGTPTGIVPAVSHHVQTRATFTVPIARTADAGSFTIEARNAAGSVSRSFSILIGPSLSVTEQANGVGQFVEPRGLARAADGTLFLADSSHAVYRIAPSGAITTLAGRPGQRGFVDGPGTTAEFRFPVALALDPAGNVYVADVLNHAVRRITPSGEVSTVAGDGSAGYVEGAAATARFDGPSGLARDPAGNLYVADNQNRVIRVISPDGIVRTLAGRPGTDAVRDGVGGEAVFASPSGLALDPAGNLLVADLYRIRKVTPAGVVTTIVGPGSNPATLDVGRGDGGGLDPARIYNVLAVDAAGVVWAGGTSVLQRIVPGQTAVTVRSIGSSVGGLAIDPSGGVFCNETGGGRIMRGTYLPGGADPHLAVAKQPDSHTVTPGASAVFTTLATGPGLTYQWMRDGRALAGANESTLWLRHTTEADAGNYSVAIGNGLGRIDSQVATLQSTASADPGRITNLSIRSQAASGAQTLLVGLVLSGGGQDVTRPLLIRGVGPTLAGYGVANALSDPAIALLDPSGRAVASNEDWGGGAELAATFSRLQAFPLPATSRGAALSLALGSGLYSVRVDAKGTNGVALVELYDAGTNDPARPRLVNVSTRAQVGTGDGVLIAGFVVTGSTSKTFLIRGVGPSLQQYGVSGALLDPRLTVYRGSTAIAENDNWGGTTALFRAFDATYASMLQHSYSTDAALLVTLAPGLYSAQVSGVGGGTGVALIELYEVE